MVCIGVFANMYIYALNKAMGNPWTFCSFQVCVECPLHRTSLPYHTCLCCTFPHYLQCSRAWLFSFSLSLLNQLIFVCVCLGIDCLQKLESCLHLLKYLCSKDLILLYLFIITLIFRVQYCANWVYEAPQVQQAQDHKMLCICTSRPNFCSKNLHTCEIMWCFSFNFVLRDMAI